MAQRYDGTPIGYRETMPRRIGDRPLTNSEKMRRWRERKGGGVPARSRAQGARERQQQRRQAEAAERGPLFRRMAIEVIGDLALDDLTVLSSERDPYRLDTTANRRDGQWFADQIAGLLGTTAIIHLRGLHYVLVSAADVVKPNGQLYRNTDKDFEWLVEHPASAARWLGIVPFESIVDERNAPPFLAIDLDPPIAPRAYLSQGSGIVVDREELLPDLDQAMPRLSCHGSAPRQPYRIVFIGEKVSLKPILQPIAERVGGDLILPTGELSDTLLVDMVTRAAADARPTVVLYLSDFDPAGYHMPVVVSRKIQALGDLRGLDLDIAVYPVALSFDQARDLNLPSTPLKETELRADGWRARWGREQTEIDALAALQPEVLRGIVETAVAPFYDPTLESRWRSAELDWRISAMRLLQAHPLYAETRAEITEALDEAGTVVDELQVAAEALDDTQRAAAERLNLAIPEPYEMPEPEIEATAPEPLFDSNDDWASATRKLIEYRSGVEDPTE
jgi:hypothetical protein